MTPRVIYEDDALIVIDKPAGLLVHGTGRDEPRTLVDFLLGRWPEIKGVGESLVRPGIVHRLDRDTSGLMVVAKTQETYEYLKQAFQERRVTKKYLALVHGTLTKTSGEITLPIGHGAHQATKRTVRRDGRGVRGEREAFTAWRLKKQYQDPSTSLGAGFALLEVEPKTGRTHQIRVHLAAIGHPVAGDPMYRFRKSINPPGLTRQFLHASYLAFSLPDGKKFVFESDLPSDLADVLNSLE